MRTIPSIGHIEDFSITGNLNQGFVLVLTDGVGVPCGEVGPFMYYTEAFDYAARLFSPPRSN